jgi:hypothetical protein
MIKGDISNIPSPRLIVTADVIANTEIETERKFLRNNVTRRLVGLNNLVLSELWRKSMAFGLTIELIAFADEGWTQEMLDKIVDRLERRGSSPINFFEIYDNVQELVDDLPYRYNLQGIVDIPERALRYGSYAVSLNSL